MNPEEKAGPLMKCLGTQMRHHVDGCKNLEETASPFDKMPRHMHFMGGRLQEPKQNRLPPDDVPMRT